MSQPSRALLRYLGSKWRIAADVVRHLPPHELYVEAFGGSAAVLAHKPRTNEVYNDLDGELVNLFQVLRSEAADALIRGVGLTLYSRAEHRLAYESADDPVERARRLLVRSHMGHANSAASTRQSNGWRLDGVTNSNDVAGQWARLPENLAMWVERLRGVQIECRPAMQLVEKFNVPKALLYLDPPYLPETRSASMREGDNRVCYAHEMTLADHQALLEAIVASRAMIVISGYPSDLYDQALKAWKRVELKARAHGNRPRIEVLWINPAAAEASGGLFGCAA